MQVSVEKTSELSRKMIVSISEEVFQEKMETRFKKLAKEVKVDGFRPGKVPTSMVKKLYGDRVRNEVTGDLIQSSYFEALQQQNLLPAGQPHIHSTENKPGFEYIAEFEVYPEISLNGVSGLQIKRPVAKVGESDVDGMIEKLREQRKVWNVVERDAQSGDALTIHFSGVAEGENFTGGTVENQRVEIGSRQMIPGFEEALVGLAVGGKKTFTAAFPEKYHNEKLAGKIAEFAVEAVKVESSSLPEIDVDFIKSYGVENGDIDTFRADVRANMERELAQGLKSRLKNTVLDALYGSIDIVLPKALVDDEIQSIAQSYVEQAKKMNLQPEDLQLPVDTFEHQAKRRVALGLILGEVVQKNSLQVDALRVRDVIEDMAKSFETPEKVISWYYSDKDRLKEVQQMVLEEQAVDWVVGQAVVTDENLGFGDVMEKKPVEV